MIGAVLIPGARAPRVIRREHLKQMKSGAVIVDVAVDQGGCIETTRPTTYEAPTYSVSGVTHFCVTNMPGAVPRTGSQALSAALIPYAKLLCREGWQQNPALSSGINVRNREIIHPGLMKTEGAG
jgi:alanine dehydrogenase